MRKKPDRRHWDRFDYKLEDMKTALLLGLIVAAVCGLLKLFHII